MKFLVSPEHARLATLANLQTAYVVFCLVRENLKKANASSHYTKKYIMSLLIDLNFPRRKWSRIFRAGNNVFWGMSHGIIHLRSYKRVTRALEAITGTRIDSRDCFKCEIEIEITSETSLQEISARLYWSWLYARGEITIARDTLQSLFGISQDTQRNYDAILGDCLLIKSNYCIIDLDKSYQACPVDMPAHATNFRYDRTRGDNSVNEVAAIQYQIPNTYIARVVNAGNRTTTAPNSLIDVIQTRAWLTTNTCAYKVLYHANMRDLERNGSPDSYVRTYYNGKRRVWRLGQYI